jgi:hypothetical protein
MENGPKEVDLGAEPSSAYSNLASNLTPFFVPRPVIFQPPWNVDGHQARPVEIVCTLIEGIKNGEPLVVIVLPSNLGTALFICSLL